MDAQVFQTVQHRLREAGIQPTLQRVAVGAVLLCGPVHMTADQVLAAARQHLVGISRATVYSLLQRFERVGLVRALPIYGTATVYDSTVAPHHHLFHTDTGEVEDLSAEDLQVMGLPALADGLRIDSVDVVVRVSGRSSAPATVDAPNARARRKSATRFPVKAFEAAALAIAGIKGSHQNTL